MTSTYSTVAPTVEAVQWRGTNSAEVEAFTGGLAPVEHLLAHSITRFQAGNRVLEGGHGDWIVRLPYRLSSLIVVPDRIFFSLYQKTAINERTPA